MDQLCGRKSTTKHTTCSRKPRRNSAAPFWKGGTKTISTESEIGWNEETFMAYDKMALEDHSYTATREKKEVGTRTHGNSH